MDVKMEPNDAGGVAAKHGFIFQDCVAAFYVTQMLRDKTIRRIRCEVTDDIDVVCDDFVEFVQVKTTTKTLWAQSDLVVLSKVASNKKIPCSSILHKSMECEPELTVPRKFRIVTEHPTNVTLEYLLISREERDGKPGRDELIKYLNSKTANYVATSGVDVANWVDAAWWQVFRTMREIELLGIRNIRLAADELHGAILSAEASAEDIWRGILDTVTRKGALSRRIHSVDSKSYLRADLNTWFQGRVEEDQKRVGRKIYVKRQLPHILVPFRAPLATPCAKRNGLVLHQQYSMTRYRYKHIVDNVCKWLDEVFLRPNELADIYKLSLVEQGQRLQNTVFASLGDVRSFLGRVLLHATIRQTHSSQPIPCMLYLEGQNEEKILENVHIVRRDPGGDELWVGFSELVTASNIAARLHEIRDELYEQIMECFSNARGKILDIKDDAYLLRHDIHTILDESNSFDSHLDRLRFVLFIGYDSTLLTEPETPGHEDHLEQETAALFEKFVDDLEHDPTFAKLTINVFIYPAPSLETLTQLVDKKVREAL
ncbi:HamA C-terminal domain-containing protein [Pseudomonas sp. PSKL.D1]|uniref:HamA C-terminal domain-containing protein n=1 Tax=Pseudomonas sp. PSKL.D1 TaxID=3029060 RepID=UPI002380CDB8|nr:dsDNA nuclease domain-containing protein [Pseudomonas sp. PSKL.D1]WDY56544.1 dsDNA nuclease domain-containing protein [Pseudomonas sp. PSKL.D1]